MRILTTILLFFSLSLSAQDFGTEHRIVYDGYDARGMWGYGDNISDNDLDDYEDYGAVGIHFIIKWNEVEPINGVYDFSDLYSNVERFAARGFYVTLQLNTGPDAPISGATDWLADLGVATFTTSGGAENGPYPDYYDDLYETRLHALYDALSTYIYNYFTPLMKRKLIGQYVVLGSTGDTGPWKGNSCTPASCLGYSDNDTWKNWSKDQVTYVQNSIHRAGLTHVSSFNEGNNHETLDWLAGAHPFAFTKNGQISHDINFFAENVCVMTNIPRIRRRGEAQGEILDGTGHAHQNGFMLNISALCLGMDFLNITGGWFNNVREDGESTADPRMTNYFVRYAPHNDVTNATKAFIQLAQKFDFADVATFPTGTYGALIDPSKTTQYNNRVTSINNGGHGATYKQWLLADAVSDFINPTRVNNIVNYGESKGASYNANPSPLSYDNDFGLYLLPNYEFHIRQVNANSTSDGAWRVGADTAIFGRFARKFNAAFDDMTFDINNKWASGRTSVQVRYTVTYLDEGTGTWNLQANTAIGFNIVTTNTNTNTGKWKQKTVTVNNQVLGTSTDFRLHYISGANTTFSMIEIEII